MSIAAKTVAPAVPSTITDNGSVASAGFADNDAPINPPIVTMRTEPVSAMTCAASRMTRLRFHLNDEVTFHLSDKVAFLISADLRSRWTRS
jgi:hypothetical protein